MVLGNIRKDVQGSKSKKFEIEKTQKISVVYVRLDAELKKEFQLHATNQNLKLQQVCADLISAWIDSPFNHEEIIKKMLG